MDKLSLYFITWNVATKPPGESVRNMLDLGRFPLNELPDFYFIGLQEVKSQPQNFVLDALLEDPWTKAFKNALSSHDYVKVKTVRLVGILLNVFCLRKHLSYLRNMESGVTRTGLMGLWGNKGSTSLRLEIYGINLCVVNAHFAAHDHQLKQRINDYNTVIREQTFALDKETTKVLYHDYVFWIGDLNFRLNSPETLTQDVITDKIRAGQLEELLEADQLVAVMRSGEAFSELNETRPTFQPTFKYQFNSHNYDNKRRCAWTDRILYKVNENNYEDVKLSLEQLKYTSLQDYGTSDHKPVLSEFKIKICPTLFASGCLPAVDAARKRRDTAPHRASAASVAFDPVLRWTLDDRNNVTVHFGGGYQPNPWDWIGVYADNFSSLDDYICYIYIPLPFPSESDLAFPLNFDEEGIDIACHGTPARTCLLGSTQNHSLLGNSSSHSRKASTPEDFPVGNELDREATEKAESQTHPTTPESEQFESRGGSDRHGSEQPEVAAPALESLLVSFPDSAIRLPGTYRLVYFTKRSSDVLGISNAFVAVPGGGSDLDRSYNLDW